MRQNVRAGPAPSVRAASVSVRVDRLERADRLADVEGRGHEGDRQDHGRLGERQLDARVAQRRSRTGRRSPPRPAAPMPATAGGSTSGSSTSVTTSARPRNRRRAMNHAVGVPKPRISALAMRFVRRVTASASWTAGSRSRPGTSRSGTWVKSATIGIARNASVIPVQSASSAVNAPRVGILLARRQPEAVALQRGASGLARDLLDEGRGAARVGARRGAPRRSGSAPAAGTTWAG